MLTILVDGDCGSWVFDLKTGDIYGHIVSGFPGTGTAYIVPASQIFQNIQRSLGKSVELFNPVSRLATNLWEKEVQEYQERVQGPAAPPLTAEMIRREQKWQASSSRTTPSVSGDELDYRNDPSTRTTRSSPGPDNENMVIETTESEMAIFSDAHIHSNGGNEITINRRMSRRNESEGSGSLHGRSSSDSDASARRRAMRRQALSSKGSRSTRSAKSTYIYEGDDSKSVDTQITRDSTEDEEDVIIGDYQATRFMKLTTRQKWNHKSQERSLGRAPTKEEKTLKDL
jgi:hypothetical protein